MVARGVRGDLPPHGPGVLQLQRLVGNAAVAAVAAAAGARRSSASRTLARQLTVDNVWYTRDVWTDTQAESDSDRREGSPPKHLLRDARIKELVEDRQQWRFESWQALDEALKAWPLGEPLPAEFRVYSTAPQGHPDTLLSLSDVIPASDTPDAILRSLDEFAKALSAMEGTDALRAEAAAQQLTSSCGLFAGTLVDAIAYAQDAPLPLVFQKTFCGQYDARALEETIVAVSHGLPLLVHVIFPKLHEFVIEKAPGGGAHLYQAWVSSFNGLWWAGFEGEGDILEKLFPGSATLRGRMDPKRADKGRGADINLTALAYDLGDFLRADVFGDPAVVGAWKRLPFIDSAIIPWHSMDARSRSSQITAEVRIYEVATARDVAARLGGVEGTPLGMMVAAWLSKKMFPILKAAAEQLKHLTTQRSHGSGAALGEILALRKGLTSVNKSEKK
jgi:hypothetical protein